MAKILETKRVTITDTGTARVGPLELHHKHAIKATAECTIHQGGSGVVAAEGVADNWPLAAMETIELTPTTLAEAYVAVIGTSGLLYAGLEEGG